MAVKATTIWSEFCHRHSVIEHAAPLFEVSQSGAVQLRSIGRTQRRVLKRSSAMESLIRFECNKCVADHESGKNRLDGIIYMMGWIDSNTNRFIPLYIGKTETIGRGDGNLSANLKNLDRDTSKFARWGDGYSYHIGDLSACVLKEHDLRHQQNKYLEWASKLFIEAPADTPVLRRPVFFWATAWNNSTTGIWTELGPTRLAFLEYTMIGVASMVSPDLLNREGQQRHARPSSKP